MGVNTTYIRRVDIVPGLNQSEYDYLTAFADRLPAGDDWAAEGLPGPWCDWEPCPHGCCLSWNGREKFNAPRAWRWMEYLIDHFLRPGAAEQAGEKPRFGEFTFDHQMDGLYPDDRPWLAGERPPRWSDLNDPPAELTVVPTLAPGTKGQRSRRRRRAD